jgi:hypothetical protein
MSRLRVVLAIVVAAAVSACGAAPASPQQTASALRIAGEAILTLEDGQSTTLRVEEGGRSQNPAQYRWMTSNPAIVTVSGDGVARAAGGYGEAIVTADSSAGSASVRIWVQYPESRPSTYRITLSFADDVHPAWRDAYAWAAERWARVIRTELPAYDLTGQSVCRFPPGIPAIAGQETGTRVVVLASSNSNTGGPCVRRDMPRPTTVLGVIEASHGASIDFDSRFTNLRGTAMHELGHVLGLVGINTFISAQTPWFDQQSSRYTGGFALEGYRRVFGVSVPYLEARAGDWHWRGFSGELMTSPASGSITTISVGALMDIGYPAAWYGADN